MLRPYPSEEDLYQAIQVDPGAIRQMDKYGSLPIHYECANKCRPSVISKLFELYPESLAVADRRGNLPLHLVLTKFLSTDIVILMIEQHPKALRHVNHNQTSPLHIECFYHCRPSISKCIELYPEGLRLRDSGGCIPWTLALYRVHCRSIISCANLVHFFVRVPCILKSSSE
jgi:hypothetical protein